MEAFKFVKSIDYPRDPETRNLTAAIHPQLQVYIEYIERLYTNMLCNLQNVTMQIILMG